MGDPSIATYILWLVAEPGFTRDGIRVVAQPVMFIKAYVTDRGFIHRTLTEEATEIDSVRLLLGQFFQHHNSLTRVDQDHLGGKEIIPIISKIVNIPDFTAQSKGVFYLILNLRVFFAFQVMVVSNQLTLLLVRQVNLVYNLSILI